MSKKEMLDLLRVLIALESWALSRKDGPLPDYLYEALAEEVEMLATRILGDGP